MTTLDLAHLVNLLGWAVGFALYAMLFSMSLHSRGRARLSGDDKQHSSSAGQTFWRGVDALPMVTAILGLLWNAGALVTHGWRSFHTDAQAANDTSLNMLLLGAASVAALGFLPTVVVHTVMQNLRADRERSRTHLLTFAAYMLSTVAAVMHFVSVLTNGGTHSNAALHILTFGFLLLMAGLFATTRGEAGWRRAVWAAALAVFAVSAVHLSSNAHDSHQEHWYLELVGHHASLPLALAILYQDYRFAFADLFLKRALTLLAFVLLVTALFTLYAVWLAPVLTLNNSVLGDITNGDVSAFDVRSVGVLLALWTVSGMLYPHLARAVNFLVEKIVLQRPDYANLRADIARSAHATERWEVILDQTCARLAPALSAHRARWHVVTEATSQANSSEDETAKTLAAITDVAGELVIRPAHRQGEIVVRIPVTDAPRYEIIFGELAGGRRLLSDDIEMLESVAVTLARRIDALRVTHERCEQVQREQEISKLATEAQLRALRAQINPHFLFNALTTIGYLIQTAPPRAYDTLMRLTDLLRRVLRAGAEWTTLGEELKLIESYLDIERARFEERLRVRFDVSDELRELLIPSLLLQPIVENAIKHGIAPLRAGGEIHISAETKDDALCITVRDTGAGTSLEHLTQGRRNGVGLGNVEQRLRLCCGAVGNLTIDTEAGKGATVNLYVPIRLSPPQIPASLRQPKELPPSVNELSSSTQIHAVETSKQSATQAERKSV